MALCIEHLPVPRLRPFVESVWYTPPTNSTAFDIVPDGCVDACFVLSEGSPRILLFGTTTRTSSYEMEANVPYFGVRFYPGKASLFVREKISNLTDTRFKVNEFLGLTAEEILDAGTFTERRLRVESSLTAALSRKTLPSGDVVSYAVTAINRSHGEIRIHDLAESCHLSERHLERLFFEKVGVTPKFYARIRRFRSVLNYLADPADPGQPKLADVAALYGYADQSHLTRDFRSFEHELSAQG